MNYFQFLLEQNKKQKKPSVCNIQVSIQQFVFLIDQILAKYIHDNHLIVLVLIPMKYIDNNHLILLLMFVNLLNQVFK